MYNWTRNTFMRNMDLKKKFSEMPCSKPKRCESKLRFLKTERYYRGLVCSSNLVLMY